MKQASSSFLQKRTKKLLSALSRTSLAVPVRDSRSKSFLLLFCKKEGLAVFLLITATQARAQEAETPSPPPATDAALPRTGTDSTISDLREHLLNAYGDTPPATKGVSTPNLQITGQFGASEEYTDNAGAVAGSGARAAGGDFITAFQPGIVITDTSQRLQVNIDYHPVAQIYAENTGFSQFEEQGNGDILATLLPGWLFFDARGSISQQAVFGGLGPASTVTLSPNERETVSSFSVSPYVTRTFGGTGTAQAGVSYSYSATDSPGSVSQFAGQTALEQAQFLQNEGAYGSSEQGTERAYANFTTGEDYGRLRDRAGIDASYYTGAGALAGGRRVLATDDASWAWNRGITLLGEAGYESLDYPRSGYSYIGPVGSGGVKLTFAKNSSATLEYRYTDGFGSILAQVSVQATPRIRIFGGYSESITTFDQDQTNTLLDGADDETGVAASALQAAPLLSTSNFFGANQNLQRLHRLDASATYLGDYDTVTVSVHRQTSNPVGRQVGTLAPVTTSGIFASISERHQLTETISLTGFLQYGNNQTGLVGSDDGDTISVAAGIEKSFPRQISAYLRFGGSYTVGGSSFAATGFNGQSPDESTITIGALKKF